MFPYQAVQQAAGAAFVILIAMAVAACGGDLPGVISGSGSAPAVSPDTPTEDSGLSADEQIYEEGLIAFDAAEAVARTGSVAEAAAKYAEAQVLFDRLWNEYPLSRRHDNAGYLRGRCRYELGDHVGAIATLGEMRAAYPDSSFLDNAAYYAGRARFELGQYLEAVADFQGSLSAGPDGVYVDNAAYYVGRSYYEAGDLVNARAALGSFESVYPQSVFIDNGRYYLGRSYFDAGLFTDSRGPFERVLLTTGSIYEDDARYYHARSFYEAGDLVNARAELAAFENTHPQSIYIDNSRYYLGRSFFDAGLYAGALGPFERVLLTTGSVFEDDARFYHARCRFQLDDFSAAVPEFRNLIALFPASQYADNALLFEMRSSLALESCPDAGTALTRLTTNYPASAFIPQAQQEFTEAGCP